MNDIKVKGYLKKGGLFEILDKKIKNGEDIILDFTGVDIIDTHFAEDNIGRLFITNDMPNMKGGFKIKNIRNDDAEIIKMVIKRHKKRAT